MKNPGVLSWPDYHPIICDPESRRAINNILFAQKSINSFGINKKSLMSYILCEKCLKMKQDYRLPCCNKCLPNHLAITVTYKYGSNGNSTLRDLKKEPVYYGKKIINIKYLLGFKIPKSQQSKMFNFIKCYQLPTIPPMPMRFYGGI